MAGVIGLSAKNFSSPENFVFYRQNDERQHAFTHSHINHLLDDPIVHDVTSGYADVNGLLHLRASVRLDFLVDRENSSLLRRFDRSGEWHASANRLVAVEDLENGTFLQRGNHLCLWLEFSHFPPA